MRQIVERVDTWARHGDFEVQDIAVFRIVFGAYVLLTLFDVGQVSSSPAAEFHPPLGPMRLFSEVPPHAALEALELATSILAALLVLGLWTRAVSFLLALALMTGFGLTYSFGKIDHTIVLVLVPAIMAFSAWGTALTIGTDRDHPDPEADSSAIAQWPMRLLAMTIALAFVPAGSAKLRSGWLDIHNHATEGHFIRGYVSNGRDDWLGPLFIRLHEGPVWELLDWLTVALELGLVLAVLTWRSFRIGVAVAAIFHLGVLLMMNITFHANVIGYGAFVRWSSFVPTSRWRGVFISRTQGLGLALVVGTLIYALHNWVDRLSQVAGSAGILIGAAMGAVYLAQQAARGVSGLRRRQRIATKSERLADR